MTFRENKRACGATGKPCVDPSLNRAGMLCMASRYFRMALGSLLFTVVASGLMSAGLLAQSQHSSPAPHGSAPHPSSSPHPSGSHPPGNQHPPPGQEHLGQWLQKNQGLTPDEQIKKLQQEKGFNQLTPQQQEGVTNRL